MGFAVTDCIRCMIQKTANLPLLCKILEKRKIKLIDGTTALIFENENKYRKIYSFLDNEIEEGIKGD
jgi:hypothetical protein